MSDKLDFSFQVLQTNLRVVYGGITDLDTEVVVSTDDTFLSASSGVAKQICDLAGRRMLRREIQKFAFPLPMSSVIVTSAGALSAKYIFHTASLDINSRPNPKIVTEAIVQQVMDLANDLRVESIVTPLMVKPATTPSGAQIFVSQLTGLPEAAVVDFILRSLACYFARAVNPISVRTITIALYQEDATDHTAAEQQLCADLLTVRNDITNWITKITPLNRWMVHVLPLLSQVADETLQQELRSYLKGGQDLLLQLFGGSELSDETLDSDIKSYKEAPLTQEEYDQHMQRLKAVADELTTEMDQTKKLQDAEQNNLYNSLMQQAQLGGETNSPLALLNQINQTRNALLTYQQQLNELEKKQAAVEQEINTLKARWQAQQANTPALPIELEVAATIPIEREVTA